MTPETPSLPISSSNAHLKRNVVLLTSTTLLIMGLAFIRWPVLITGITDERFLPHKACYLLMPGLIALHRVSDFLIGCAYTALALSLAYLVHRARRDIPFSWMFLAFGVFIVACGGTHFMEVITLERPLYWLAGDVKAVTAVASVLTAVLFPPVIPKVLEMIRAARLSNERQEQLEIAHARLKELDELKTQFFANVSHELRTPLALILGPTENLLKTPLNEEQRGRIQGIERNARLLLKHVNDLLMVSKLKAGKMFLQYSEFDFCRLVRVTAGYFETLASDRHIRYELETPESLFVQGDPEKIEHVLLNLLANAFKFTPDGGIIRIALETADEGRIAVSVSDSGIGVRPEHRQIIFEAFRQAEGGLARRFGGTGLGLAIVKDFVELHQGKVSVDDAREGGARFTVEIPMRSSTPTDLREGEEEPAAGTPPDLALVKMEREREIATATDLSTPAQDDMADAPLVLVVEDNHEMNDFVAETLAANFRVARAYNGREGAAMAAELHPAMVVTDIMMPEMSGDQLVHEIRNHSDLDDVPVLILSARADEHLRSHLLSSGVQDYVTKPFSAEELMARVHNLAAISSARRMLRQALDTRDEDIATMTQVLLHRNEEIRKSEATFRSLEEALPTLVWMSGPSGQIEYVNHRWTEYTGQEQGVMGIWWKESIHEEDLMRARSTWLSSLTSKEGCRIEHRLKRRDDVYRWHLAQLIPLKDDAGRVTRWVGTSTDIHDQKEAEVLMRRYANELEAAVAERTAKLKDTLAELEAFSYSVSHDLQAPLRAIEGFARVLKEEAGQRLEARDVEHLQFISQGAQRMTILIKDLLHYGRISRADLTLAPANLRAIVEAAAEQVLHRSTGEPQLKIEEQIEIEEHLAGSVRANSSVLTQVVVNLVSNAFKFHKPGSASFVRIWTEETEDSIRLSVEDNGIGIAQNNHDRIFNVFERLHPPGTYEGTGIGLAIVKRAVTRMGGRCGVISRLGEGSTFWIELPKADAAALPRGA